MQIKVTKNRRMAILNKIITVISQLAITAIIIHMETMMTTTKKAKKTLIRIKITTAKYARMETRTRTASTNTIAIPTTTLRNKQQNRNHIKIEANIFPPPCYVFRLDHLMSSD